MRRIGFLLCLAALTGCGSGAAVSSHAVTHSRAASGLPDEIVQYTVAGIGQGPGMGPETVWWDPATGQGRDRQGPSAGVSELVIVGRREATQTDWNGAGPGQTTVTSGSTQFVQAFSGVSASWMVRAYLLRRLGMGPQRIQVGHHGGRVVLTSVDGEIKVRVTITRVLRPTPALRQQLFSPRPVNVTARTRQLAVGSRPPAPAAGFWLGARFAGLAPADEFIDAPVSGPPSGWAFGIRYGVDTIDIQSGARRAGFDIAQMVASHSVARPVACRLADGTPAHATQFPMGPTPSGTHSSTDLRQMARTRVFIVWTDTAHVTVFAPVSLLATPRAACAAIRPL